MSTPSGRCADAMSRCRNCGAQCRGRQCRACWRSAFPDPLARLMTKVVETPDGCWQFTEARTDDGYGMFWVSGRSIAAHIAAYRLIVGPVPEGKQLDHKCNNRSCVRPHVDHVRPLTARENVLRGIGPTARNARKTRCKRGHAFTPENTYTVRRMRHCRACRLARDRARRAKERTVIYGT